MRRIILGVLLAALSALLVVVALALASNPAGELTTDYCAALSSDTVQGVWYREQEPAVDGVTQTDRISMRCAFPGRGQTYAPTDAAMRVELRQGDDYNGTNRAEVYDEFPATPASGTGWPGWPLAANGGEHWVRFSVYIEQATFDSSKWRDILQFKGYRGGSPPIAEAIDGGRFKIVGRRNVFLGPATPGVWHDFVIHIKLAADAGGLLEVWQDGVNYMPLWTGQTMDLVNGAPDPVYLKQGDYRTASWPDTDVFWFGPTRVTPTS